MSTPSLLNETEVAAIMKVEVGTVTNWRYQRRGPPWIKVGGAVRYRREDLDEYLAAQVTRQPVKAAVADADILAAVDAVHGFGTDRAGAAREIKRWLVEEVGVTLRPGRRGEHTIRVGRINAEEVV
jgi:Helix-turn-helix domain